MIEAAADPAPVLDDSPAARPVIVTVRVRLRALALQEADGRYSVVVPALPGCVTMGDDVEQVEANLVEAAELWLESQFDRNKEEAVRIARD